MASTNQSPFYKIAEEKYLKAIDPEEKLRYLEEMIKESPKHKSSEKMNANLKNRYRKLKESLEKQKKSGKGKKIGIRKQDMQCIIVGFPNTGKSSLFKILTNQNVKISQNPFSTPEPELGTTNYEDTKIQVIDMPPFPNHDQSILNTTDTIFLVVNNITEIKKSLEFLKKSPAKIILIYNKIDLLNETQKRKINATLKSKFKNLKFYLFSCAKKDTDKINELKKYLFETFPIIRVYTKEPKKAPSLIPMILKKDSTIEDAAEKILKGLSSKIKKSKIWGPSSKFPGQIVGLDHIIKDKDTIEFQTK